MKNYGGIFGVSRQDICRAEYAMDLHFPPELKEFYLTEGFGYMFNGTNNINRLLSPIEVAKFRLQEGEFAKRSAEFDLWQKDRLFFFQESVDTWYAIELSYGGRQKIYYYETVISESLKSFMKWIRG